MRPLRSAGFGTGRCRGQKTPPTETPAPAADRARFLWEQPWPRRGRCGPRALVQAAVGVRRPLPQKPGPGASRGSGAFPVGAALAATRPLKTAGYDSGSNREQARSQRLLHRTAPSPPPLSGSEDPSHTTLGPALAPDSARSLWERPWPRRGRHMPPTSIQFAVGVRRPITRISPGTAVRSVRLPPTTQRTDHAETGGEHGPGAGLGYSGDGQRNVVDAGVVTVRAEAQHQAVGARHAGHE